METTGFDVGLFETLSALLKEQTPVSTPANRRDGERRPFPYSQLIAPFDGERLPSPDQLRAVRCHDLSPNGFSFRAARQPDFKYVVIGLGQIPLQFFVAEVVHVRPLGNGLERIWHVGCRFLRRVVSERA